MLGYKEDQTVLGDSSNIILWQMNFSTDYLYALLDTGNPLKEKQSFPVTKISLSISKVLVFQLMSW